MSSTENTEEKINKLEAENAQLKDLLKSTVPSMWAYFELELKQANYVMCDKVRSLINTIKSKTEK